MTALVEAHEPLDAGEPRGGDGRGDLGRMARNGLWSVLAHVASAGAVFLTSVLIGRVAGVEALGRYSFYVWMLRLAQKVLALGVPSAITRLTSEKDGEGSGAALAGVFAHARRLHLLLVPVPAAVLAAVVWDAERDLALGLAVAAALAIGLLALDYEALLSGVRRFRALSGVAIVSAVAQVALSGLAAASGATWRGYVVASIGASAIGYLAVVVASRSTLRSLPAPHLDPVDRQAFSHFARVVAVVVLLDAFVWGRPELWFLERFSTDAQLGWYSAALRLASLPTVLPLVAGRVLLPEFSWLRAAGREEDVQRIFPRLCTMLALVTAPVALGGALLAGPMVDLIFGAGFEGAHTATAILFGGSIVNAMAPAVSAAVLTGPRPKFVAEAGAVALIVNLLLALWLVPAYGATGAAVATTVVQLALIPVAAYYVGTRLGLPYPLGRVGAVVGLGFAAALAALATVEAVGGLAGLVAAVAVGAVVYLAAVLATGLLRVSDLRALRGGDAGALA